MFPRLAVPARFVSGLFLLGLLASVAACGDPCADLQVICDDCLDPNQKAACEESVDADSDETCEQNIDSYSNVCS